VKKQRAKFNVPANGNQIIGSWKTEAEFR